ncbi:MAG: phnF [Devosia sp.]|uniref:phosphonate metabolism transcriptional regulator PhnF n=1 Tax=Devosia sp. TaxID=1871048 RepID=UPI002602DE10|nr:phosphonate metabolism transcriptional regulator PhnF [Devosia sp.]MDB5529806.1 phnF [Devosia sp.]
MTKVTAVSDSHLSGVAIWRRIADAVRLDIVGGKLARGDKLAGEVELAERFGANRHTVRRALQALAAEGVIRTEQGRGSFVDSAKRLSYRIGKRTRFSEGLAGQASELRRQVLGTRLENASASVAAALGLVSGAKVTRLDTVSLADGRPVSRATSWVGYRDFPEFAARFAEEQSTTAVFAGLGVSDYVRASTRISARHADAEETALLKLAPGAILLVSEGVDADVDGRPILYGLSRFPADLMELVV